MGNLDWDVLLIPVVVVGVILILGLAFWARYKTVGPDEAMIVTVNANLVPLIADGLNQLRMMIGDVAQRKKCRLYPMRFKKLQERRRHHDDAALECRPRVNARIRAG